MTHIATTKYGSLIFAESPSISRPERRTYRVEGRDTQGLSAIETGLELAAVERIVKREGLEWAIEGEMT